jgi:hypothetical protein
VSELIKNIIVWHERIFPLHMGGTRYEKFIMATHENGANMSSDDR